MAINVAKICGCYNMLCLQIIYSFYIVFII